MRRLLYILPVLAFAALALVLLGRLEKPATERMASGLIGHQAPSLDLPPLAGDGAGLRSAMLRQGQATVVNLFASWCVPCRAEAPALAKLKARGVRILGVAYKDKPEAARDFLQEVGNPFTAIGTDTGGQAGVAWGISGVPETFIIDGHGVVRAHYGPLTEADVDADVLPAIAAAGRP